MQPTRRLLKEAERVSDYAEDGVIIFVNPTNIFHWEAVISGPEVMMVMMDLFFLMWRLPAGLVL